MMATKVANTIEDLRVVLDECRAGFKLRRVPATATDQWSLTEGALQHRSGGFFSAVGVDDGKEQKLLLYQPQAAVTGILSTVVDGDRWFLLQARAEPGCLGEAQFGPTVQSTPANFMRLHGGKATPYVDAFIAYDPDVSLLDDTTQLDLGERYAFKTKRSILLETSQPVPTQPAFVWARPTALYDALRSSAFLNIDLRSILAIAPWSSDLTPRSDDIAASLHSPVRGEVIGALLRDVGRVRSPGLRFTPLSSLKNWQQTEWGWSETESRQGFAIDFYEVKAAFREVGGWIQPLVNSTSEGHVVLAMRRGGGELEVLLRTASETGLASNFGVGPSFVRYPGATDGAPAWMSVAHTLSSTLESDEGGRFYRDASRYEIVEVAGDAVADGVWARISELKALLRMSNVCTIQLRGVASQLLAIE